MYSKQSKWLAASCLSRIIMLRIGSCTPFFSLHLDLTRIGWMSEWMNGWMDERTNARKNDWMNGVIIQSIQQPLNHSIDQPIINRSDNWTGVCIFGFCIFNMCLFTFSACSWRSNILILISWPSSTAKAEGGEVIFETLKYQACEAGNWNRCFSDLLKIACYTTRYIFQNYARDIQR